MFELSIQQSNSGGVHDGELFTRAPAHLHAGSPTAGLLIQAGLKGLDTRGGLSCFSDFDFPLSATDHL